MTTLTNYLPYFEVMARIEAVRGRIRTLRFTEGFFSFMTVFCGAILGVTLVQGFLRFGPAGRLALLLVGAGAILWAFWRHILSPLRREPNPKEVARFIEIRLPQLGNSLINTLLLTERASEWSPVLVQMAVSEAAAGVVGVDLLQATSTRRAKRRAAAAAAAALALAVFIALAAPRFLSAGLQVLLPFDKGIPSAGAVSILSVAPGTVEWTKGEPMDIEAAIADPHGRSYDGSVEIREEGGATLRRTLTRAGERLDRFTYRVPQVVRPFDYRLNVGGSESRRFTVTLREPPLIETIDLRYIYPDYTGLEPQAVTDTGGEIRCLVGTRVEMTVRASAPVAGASLLFGNGEALKCLPASEGRSLAARFTVLADDVYQIRLEDHGPDRAAVVYRIVALEDEPPAVVFTLPQGDVVASPGETVTMSLKAADRFGLADVRLFAQADTEPQPVTVQVWRKFADPKDAILDYAFLVDPAKYRPGQTITCWAEARDRRTYQGGRTPQGPNVTATAKFRILIQDKKAAAGEKIRQLTLLFERLREILKAQETARATLETVGQQKSLDAVRAVGAGLTQAQRAIRDSTVAVTREVAFDAETMPIQVTLEALSANEMASAVTKAAALAAPGAEARLADLAPLAGALAADQDAVIAVLRRILDILPRLADAVRADQNRLAPADLPPDAQAKLAALRDRLKEFIDQQKKVIEATKELAKRPVDDFTEADQRDLKKLEAVEDQWDKFLEVKTDVEMAEDALSKKAMDIVVPLEELGMEAAQEIVENLERWLPDQPDRAAWKQEEALGDVEIPHAELPAEMEDLVGDLLEQEEDLFQEIEDTTSAAADSADKGAGWDAMDGPISNYSAKGVTGNALPNTSEVGGRSGEGRTGKSSGEFVEEDATGKGGRRTPTRLSPDAFSRGEVNDSSAEAPTGATGGGKISGAGSEGLEGPVPPELARRMGGLAKKQAQLRNKAEGVKAGLEVRNYQSFALGEAVEAMRRVQRDLLAGRYQNALRQRDVVLENLKSTKMLLGGEVRIRTDTSTALPTEVQDELLDALEKPMPRGYEDYLKRYYERLSQGR
ncbi:MAG: hypothetical protein NTX40_11115 [Planctomycetota bacterium]|nr:hypothetical protein [Planctomycetota bacterium]